MLPSLASDCSGSRPFWSLLSARIWFLPPALNARLMPYRHSARTGDRRCGGDGRVNRWRAFFRREAKDDKGDPDYHHHRRHRPVSLRQPEDSDADQRDDDAEEGDQVSKEEIDHTLRSV